MLYQAAYHCWELGVSLRLPNHPPTEAGTGKSSMCRWLSYSKSDLCHVGLLEGLCVCAYVHICTYMNVWIYIYIIMYILYIYWNWKLNISTELTCWVFCDFVGQEKISTTKWGPLGPNFLASHNCRGVSMISYSWMMCGCCTSFKMWISRATRSTSATSSGLGWVQIALNIRQNCGLSNKNGDFTIKNGGFTVSPSKFPI